MLCGLHKMGFAHMKWILSRVKIFGPYEVFLWPNEGLMQNLVHIGIKMWIYISHKQIDFKLYVLDIIGMFLFCKQIYHLHCQKFKSIFNSTQN